MRVEGRLHFLFPFQMELENTAGKPWRPRNRISKFVLCAAQSPAQKVMSRRGGSFFFFSSLQASSSGLRGQRQPSEVTSASSGARSNRTRVWFSFTVWGRPAVGRGRGGVGGGRGGAGGRPDCIPDWIRSSVQLSLHQRPLSSPARQPPARTTGEFSASTGGPLSCRRTRRHSEWGKHASDVHITAARSPGRSLLQVCSG